MEPAGWNIILGLAQPSAPTMEDLSFAATHILADTVAHSAPRCKEKQLSLLISPAKAK